MPFIAPFVPMIAAGVGGLLSGRSKKQQTPQQTMSPEERELYSQQSANVRTGREAATGLLPYGADFMRQAQGTFTPLLNYYSRMLSGNRGALTNLYAPELNRISEGYRTAQQTSSELAPRSGGSAAMREELPYRQARDVSELFLSGRPAAAGALGTIGTNLASLGLGSYGTAGSLLSGSSAGASNLLGYGINSRYGELARRQQEFDQQKQTAGGIYNILKQIDWSKIFKRGQTGP
jgi:hypothetical protein